MFYLPCQLGSTLNGKNLIPEGKDLLPGELCLTTFFSSRPNFQRGLCAVEFIYGSVLLKRKAHGGALSPEFKDLYLGADLIENELKLIYFITAAEGAVISNIQ